MTFSKDGRRVIRSAQSMKARANIALAELRIAEKALADVLEEARRDGALPGWLRDDGRGAVRGVSRPVH